MTDKTDTSREAVERIVKNHDLISSNPAHYSMSDSGHSETATILRALLAERDALQAKVEALHSAQSYTYIGKDGIPVLARDLEDQRDAAYTAGFEAAREMAADWHDQRARATPDAFAQEFHEVSRDVIRALSPAEGKQR